MFKKARRKIAGFILGDDTAMFVSKESAELLKSSAFLDASDEVIGKMYKYFWALVLENQNEHSKTQGMSFRAKMRSASVLYLASEMHKIKADSATYSVKGSIDGGKTYGAWAVRVEANPDYDDSPDGQQEVDGKIVSLTLSHENPGYEEWRQKNEEKRQAALEKSKKDS